MTKYRLAYDTEPCTRCGGTGQYSRCEMYGSDCFKCVVAGNRAGLQSTKAAIKARAAVEQFREELLKVAVSDLKVGDQIDAGSVRSNRGKTVKLTITEIGQPRVLAIGAVGAEACRWMDETARMPIEQKTALVDAGAAPKGVNVQRVVTLTGAKASVDARVGGTVLRMPTQQDVDKIVEFARTLKGVSVVEVTA